MSYPTQHDVIDADPLLAWIDRHFLRPDPYLFRNVDFKNVVDSVTDELDVDANGVFCIGSAAIGISLNPDKISEGLLKTFGDDSDLDLAIISEEHFERAWRDLRRATQPTLREVSPIVSENLRWQKKRFFDGAIVASRLLPSLSFGTEWITALVRVNQEISMLLEREVTINVWIYRDYWSLRNYVSESIIKCRGRLV